jgi:hypothetical protein
MSLGEPVDERNCESQESAQVLGKSGGLNGYSLPKLLIISCTREHTAQRKKHPRLIVVENIGAVLNAITARKRVSSLLGSEEIGVSEKGQPNRERNQPYKIRGIWVVARNRANEDHQADANRYRD